MDKLVSAEEARKLLDGARGPFSLWLPDADGDWRIVAHDTPMKRRRVVAKCGYAREEAAMLAAAPDLATTVVALSEERDAYRDFAHRIAAIMAPPDAVDMAVKYLEFHGLDDLAETVEAVAAAESRAGRKLAAVLARLDERAAFLTRECKCGGTCYEERDQAIYSARIAREAASGAV